MPLHPPVDASSDDDFNSNDVNIGAVVGGTVGGLVGIACCGFLYFTILTSPVQRAEMNRRMSGIPKEVHV